jgi:hypothetical protein
MSDTITAKVSVGEDDDEVNGEVNYNFGENLEEAIDLFGTEVVYKRFKAAVVVDLQGIMRRHMSAKEPLFGDDLQAKIDEWKPGVQKARKSKTEKALSLLEGMTADEKAEFIASLD